MIFYKACKATILLTFIAISSTASANNISYIIAARQGDLFKAQDRIADMVANVNTTSFKAELGTYSEQKKLLENGESISFSGTNATYRNFSQGSLTSTSRELDIAINGEGFFMIDTPRGKRFTRSGNLKINSEGSLANKAGFPLLSSGGGSIEFAENDINITITEDGIISANGEQRGQIGVFIFENEQLLTREGLETYKTTQTAIPTQESQIVQGMLESSNINSVTAMTDLITVSRNIETTKKIQSDFHNLQMNLIRKLTQQ